MSFYTKFEPSTMVFLCNIYGEDLQILRQKRGVSFLFMKREKKGRCFFAYSSKIVRTKVSRSTKKYITSLNIHIVNNCFLYRETAYKDSTVQASKA
jgi:hypothetical protein